MKRVLLFLLLSASLAWGQDVRLPRTTVMQSGNQLITLPPGTVVKMIEQGDKTVTIKIADKVGTIDWTALDAEPPRRAMIVRHLNTDSASPSTQPATPPSAATSPATPRPAQSTYGRMVEKARETESAHHQNLVAATNAVLAGK